MNGNKVPLIILICAIAVMAAVVISFVLFKKEPAFDEYTETIVESIPELKIVSVDENGDKVDVETTYGNLSYSSAFADIVNVKAVNDGKTSSLQFFANIKGSDTLLYSVHYNSDLGSPCGKIKPSEIDTYISVSVVFSDAPESFDDDWASAYGSIQETFNDVIASMSENESFVPVQ